MKRNNKRIQKRSTPGGTILPFLILCGFIALSLYAWQAHIEQEIDTDPDMQAALSKVIDDNPGLPETQSVENARTVLDLFADDGVREKINCQSIPKRFKLPRHLC